MLVPLSLRQVGSLVWDRTALRVHLTRVRVCYCKVSVPRAKCPNSKCHSKWASNHASRSVIAHRHQKKYTSTASLHTPRLTSSRVHCQTMRVHRQTGNAFVAHLSAWINNQCHNTHIHNRIPSLVQRVHSRCPMVRWCDKDRWCQGR